MQIIQKPKQHKLPFLHPRIISQSSQPSSIPNVYIQSRAHKKNAKSTISRDITVSYNEGSKRSQVREILRKALSAHMNFEFSQQGIFKFQAQQITKKVKQSIKVIPYQSEKYEKIYEIVKQIFGEDIQLSPKDLMGAYGSVTQSFYVFFTSPYYQPTSFCCQEVVYLKIENNQKMPSNRYAKMETSMEFFQKVQSRATKFVCLRCNQPILIIQKKSKKNISESRAIGKQKLHFEAERQKISMSILVASGRFKKIRIDEPIHKDNILNSIEVKNLTKHEQALRRKNRTLVLRPIDEN